MKCPNPVCQYEHGYNAERDEDVRGKHGNFYKNPVKLEQRVDYHDDNRATLYACPKCRIAFIGDPE